MKFIKKYISKLLFATFLTFAPVVSLAQTKIENPLSVDTVNEFIRILLEGILKIGIPIVALAIIYCGFLFVSATGNSEKIKKAKEALLYTLIGAAILLGAWALAKLIAETVLSIGKP